MIFTVTSKGTGVAVGVNVGVAVGNGVAVQAAAVMVATSSADGPQLASRRIAANKRAAKTFFIVELLHISVDFLAKKIRNYLSSGYATSLPLSPSSRQVRQKQPKINFGCRYYARSYVIRLMVDCQLKQMNNSKAYCPDFNLKYFQE